MREDQVRVPERRTKRVRVAGDARLGVEREHRLADVLRRFHRIQAITAGDVKFSEAMSWMVVRWRSSSSPSRLASSASASLRNASGVVATITAAATALNASAVASVGAPGAFGGADIGL